jgi:hypothetical protein
MSTRRIGQVGVGAILLLSVVAKLYAPWDVEVSLAFLGFQGVGILMVMAGLLGMETFAGYCLIADGGRPIVIGSSLLLVAFTAVLARFLLAEDPPSCGCLGLVRVFESNRSEAVFGIGRNCLLLAMLLPSLSAPARRERPS